MAITNKIIPVSYKEWRRFQPYLGGGPCCNLAFPQGECFAILAADDVDSMAAMVWYTYAYRNNPWRRTVIPGLPPAHSSAEMVWLNQNIRLLARVSTLPPYRRLGFAHRLVAATVAAIGVPYVECLTAWNDVRSLLAATGFVDYGFRLEAAAWYYLWRMKAANEGGEGGGL